MRTKQDIISSIKDLQLIQNSDNMGAGQRDLLSQVILRLNHVLTVFPNEEITSHTATVLSLYKNNKMAMLAESLEPAADFWDVLDTSLKKNNSTLINLIQTLPR